MLMNPGIFGRKFMSVFAVGFIAPLLPRVSTAHIFPMGYRLQVSWIHAARIAAEMVEFESIWDRPHKQFPCCTVSPLCRLVCRNLAIAAASSSRPYPTSRRWMEDNLFGEAAS